MTNKKNMKILRMKQKIVRAKRRKIMKSINRKYGRGWSGVVKETLVTY